MTFSPSMRQVNSRAVSSRNLGSGDFNAQQGFDLRRVEGNLGVVVGRRVGIHQAAAISPAAPIRHAAQTELDAFLRQGRVHTAGEAVTGFRG